MNYEILINEGVIDPRGSVISKDCNCSSCGLAANRRYFESCNGGCLNQQEAIECDSCGFHSCDDECCHICNERFRIESEKSVSSSLGISSSVDAYIFLANLELELMAILAKAEINIPGLSSPDEIRCEALDHIHSCANDMYNFSLTEYTDLPISLEIKKHIFILLGALNELTHWSDSF